MATEAQFKNILSVHTIRLSRQNICSSQRRNKVSTVLLNTFISTTPLLLLVYYLAPPIKTDVFLDNARVIVSLWLCVYIPVNLK